MNIEGVKRKSLNVGNEVGSGVKKSKKLLPDRSKKLKIKKSLNSKEEGSLLKNVNEPDEGILDQNDADISEDEIQTEIEDISTDDPFRLQFEYELSPECLQILSSKPPQQTTECFKWPALGNISFSRPDVKKYNEDNNLSIAIDKTIYASPRNILKPSAEVTLDKLCIKAQILNNTTPANERFLNEGLTDFQKELFLIISNYQDLYFTERTFNNGEHIRMVYCVHALNHALKTRMKILLNNSKISKGKDNDYRDHGLVRPKVLILVPFKDSALRVVKMMMALLLGESGNVINKKRFLESYSGETLRMPKKNPKPPDYEQIFYGNTDDNFRVGLALTKRSIKLYADFYTADIIVASPLGLRILIGAEGEPNRNYDFLSSVELLILDQAELFVMQNWEHVLHIMSHMHLVPKESHGTDLTRVRMWALNGWSKYYMQNLVFCSHPLPEITAFFNSSSKNFAGRVIATNPVVNGSIRQIIVTVPQLFHEISVSSLISSIETRFEVFVSKFLPQFRDPLMKHTLIYIPSYFDFVKIRNHFKKQDISFVQICEYTKENKIARARDLFYHGEVHFMIYSERFHFFRRIRLKGIRHIFFYQPPAFPHFYSEMCNFLKDDKRQDTVGLSDLSISMMFTKYDATQLAAIVGTDRATRMLASDKSVHMFMTEDS